MARGKPRDGSKNPGGRPQKSINFSYFEELCGFQCTLEEIAAAFDTTPELIERKVVEHYGKSFREVFAAKRSKGNVSLRRKQNQLALKGDRTMLIWLGKNRLNQRERHEVSGPDGKAIPVSIEGAQAALADLLDEVLKRDK